MHQIPAGVFCVAFGAADVDAFAPAIAYARAAFHRTLLVESAGLFWILAELLILLLVIAGRTHIETEPLPARLAWNPRDRCRAAVSVGIFAALVLIVFGRHLFLAPVDTLVGSGVQPIDVQTAFAVRMHVHLTIWAGFVTIWVLLESAIVYVGWRGYRRLRGLLQQVPRDRQGVATPCLLPILAFFGSLLISRAVFANETILDALHAADAADAVYWNALYLYLRLAGAVWIAVEWIAAILLWRGYRLLRNAARERGLAP